MKRYLTFAFLLGSAVASWCIPADPTPKKFIQPDGSEMTVIIRGDEYGHTVYALDGTPLSYDGSRRMYVRSTDAGLMNRGMRKSNGKKRVKAGNYPTVGKTRNLVVLVEYADLGFNSVSDPRDFYTRMLNEKGFTHENGANGSARDFYLASSGGRFDPEFDVVGPVKLSKNHDYYGSDERGQDYRMSEFLPEVLNLIDDEVDFSIYDTDNDGYIDNVYFFYAGNGQADTPGGTSLIWPHSADASVAWKLNLEYDGKKFEHYAISNEVRYDEDGKVQPTGIGTFVHEFGHVLGLMDHYDTGYSMFAFGLGEMDTMAAGSYNNNMHTPPYFSLFERVELGWAEYTDLDSRDPMIRSLRPIGDEAEGFRVSVPGKENEWFVLENRQQRGWDEYLPAHGMLIWHIDYDQEIWDRNAVNTDATHQRIDIVEVDGIGTESSRDGDTMPGAANITSFLLKSWDDAEILDIDHVEENAEGVIRLLLGKTAFSLDDPHINIENVSHDSFTFSWLEVEDACMYKVNVNDGKNAISGFDDILVVSPESMTVKGLQPESEYNVVVTALRGSYASFGNPLVVVTDVLPFTLRVPAISGAEGDDKGNISVRWSALDDASDYKLYVNKYIRNTSQVENGYDFSGKQDGMPTGWESSSLSYTSVDGYYGESAPSLRFSKDAAYLSVSYPELIIDRISFWHRANGAGGKIVVENMDGVEPVILDEVPVDKDAGIASVDCGGASSVRLRFSRVGGSVSIDDVSVSGRDMLRNPVSGYDGKSVGNVTQFVVPGLASGEYVLRLAAVCGDDISALSPEVKVVVGNSGVSSVDDIAFPVRYIDINGNESLKPFSGFNIVVYSDGSYKKEIKKY